jgi:hypothetical protein
MSIVNINLYLWLMATVVGRTARVLYFQHGCSDYLTFEQQIIIFMNVDESAYDFGRYLLPTELVGTRVGFRTK